MPRSFSEEDFGFKKVAEAPQRKSAEFDNGSEEDVVSIDSDLNWIWSN